MSDTVNVGRTIRHRGGARLPPKWTPPFPPCERVERVVEAGRPFLIPVRSLRGGDRTAWTTRYDKMLEKVDLPEVVDGVLETTAAKREGEVFAGVPDSVE